MTYDELLKTLRLGKPVQQQTLSDLDLGQLRQETAIFTDVHFHNVRWQGAQLTQCIFTRCRFTQDVDRHLPEVFSDWRNVSLQGCHFDRCDLGHSQWVGQSLTTCTFNQCNLSNSNWQAAQLSQLSFTQCDCRQASFVDARVERSFQRLRQ